MRGRPTRQMRADASGALGATHGFPTMIQSDRRPDTTGPPSSAVAEVSFTSACNGSEYAGAERSLLGLPGVTAAHFDRTRGVAHVTYDRSDGKVSQGLCDS